MVEKVRKHPSFPSIFIMIATNDISELLVSTKLTDTLKVLRDLSQSLDRVELLSGSSHSASLIQLSLAADIQKLADDLASQSTPLDALRKEATTERRWFDRLVMLLFQHDPPSESARLVRSRAATALARLASKMNQTAGSILRSKLESSLQAERSSAVAESLNAAIRLLT